MHFITVTDRKGTLFINPAKIVQMREMPANSASGLRTEIYFSANCSTALTETVTEILAKITETSRADKEGH